MLCANATNKIFIIRFFLEFAAVNMSYYIYTHTGILYLIITLVTTDEAGIICSE